MESFKKTKNKLNNRGMTLVELIVAIAILAIALIPLMYAFVNVAKYSGKARQLQQATSISHTVMENCKAYSVEDIEDQVSNGEFFQSKYAAEGLKVKAGTAGYHVDGTNPYKFYVDDVQVDNQAYDVCFELESYKDSLNNIASKPIMTYENINPTLDAIFMSQSTTISPTDSTVAAILDEMAYWEAMNQIATNVKTYTQDTSHNLKELDLSDVEVEASFGTGELNDGNFVLNRLIEVNMLPAADGETAEVVYKYTYSITGGNYLFEAEYETLPTPAPGATPDPNPPTTTEVPLPVADTIIVNKTFDIYQNATMNDTLTDAEINDVYLFYNPGYSTVVDYKISEDKIVINNDLGRAVDLYLFKQIDLGLDETIIQIAEDSYGPKVELAAGSGSINLYHNLDKKLINGGSTSAHSIASTITQKTEAEQLNKVDTVLMYKVLVNIYNSNAYDSTTNQISSGSTPVLTLDGTKVNW